MTTNFEIEQKDDKNKNSLTLNNIAYLTKTLMKQKKYKKSEIMFLFILDLFEKVLRKNNSSIFSLVT